MAFTKTNSWRVAIQFRRHRLIEDTGASDGGAPELAGQSDENDIITAMRLFLRRAELNVPATHNGLGYNNLVYISVLLASLDFKADAKRRGQNAVLYPMLVIEEPEAHLHPALQYKLLKYIQDRLKNPSEDHATIRSRQVFITSHSTQITAAAGLEPITCLSISEDNTISVAYPGRVFGNDADGVTSRKHVERYLDATKSSMLFAKGVVFVEGMAELLLIPCLAEYIDSPLERHHATVVAVDGVSFKHFLPLFGGGPVDRRQYALSRPVACLTDADPSRKLKGVEKARHKRCWPFEIGLNEDEFEYRALSFIVDVVKDMCVDSQNLNVYYGTKTLEYDLAYANANSSALVTPRMTNSDALTRLASDPNDLDDTLAELISECNLRDSLDHIGEPEERCKATFATCYLLSVGSKGAMAFEVMHRLRENLTAEASAQLHVNVPCHIREAIRWACRLTPDGA